MANPNGSDPNEADTDAAGLRGAPSLIGDVMTHISNLLRKEFDLARAEMSEKVNQAALAVGLLVGAVVVALVALNTLAAALAAGIAELGLAPGWAALLVGVALAILAFLMVRKGTHDLKLTSLAPSRTSKNVQRDAEVLKETLQ